MAQGIERLISKWLEQGMIDQILADKMLMDITEDKKERSSNKLIVVLSTLGSLLLGIGAFLFMASNWMTLSSLAKVFLLIGGTAGSYYAGYVLKYEKANYPRVGNSLLFLGSLLFGASVFLIAQIYHVNANSHLLVLVWLAGIIPLVYAFSNGAIAGLAAVLFYLWIGLFVFRGISFNSAANNFIALPALFLVSGNLLFQIGNTHYFKGALQKIARIYRLISLKVMMAGLFFLSFKTFSGHHDYYYNVSKSFAHVTGQFNASFIIFVILALILTVINLAFNPTRSKSNIMEDSISLGLLGFTALFFYFPSVTNIYTVLFNLILAGLIIILLMFGYQREDMKIVNIGMSYLGLFILVRYFDFFWELLPRSLFFLVGGFILIVGGIALEKKRKELKIEFSQVKTGGNHHE
ncbi:MAG: DUF2157 domain-containing protein [Candidatus Omnitrophota bacterium]